MRRLLVLGHCANGKPDPMHDDWGSRETPALAQEACYRRGLVSVDDGSGAAAAC